MRSSIVGERLVASTAPKEWVHSWQPSDRPSQTARPEVTSQMLARRTSLSILVRQEAAFMEWWCKSCSNFLQPRGSDCCSEAGGYEEQSPGEGRARIVPSSLSPLRMLYIVDEAEAKCNSVH